MDHVTNVTSYRMDISTAANPSTATPVRTNNLGKPALVNGDITVNIAALVQGLPTGRYFLTVTAIGAGGSSHPLLRADTPVVEISLPKGDGSAVSGRDVGHLDA